jgi:hypothetical protein
MKSEVEYKTIFILSAILVITTIIGEFYRIENIKEGMNFGRIISKVFKLIIAVFAFFMMIADTVKWLLEIIFTWVPFLIIWILEYILCAFQMLMNIPNCSLWYGLSIAGKILYLPFRLTFYGLDILFAYVKIPFSIQNMVNQIWWFLDDIDHLLYDNGSGFHIIHYPDDINKRCFSCKISKLKKIPKFPMKFVRLFLSNIK